MKKSIVEKIILIDFENWNFEIIRIVTFISNA